MPCSMQPSYLGSERCIQGKTGTDSCFQKDQENRESVLGNYKSLTCLAGQMEIREWLLTVSALEIEVNIKEKKQ